MPTTFAPDKAFLGIAPETTVGTPVAPTFTIPFAKFEPVDAPKQLDDPSLRGSMAALYGRYQGVSLTNWSLSGPMYVDIFEHLLVNILGDRTTTGAADPFTHATSLLNSSNGQPKTHTLTHWTGVPTTSGARVYSSACLSDLTIKWDAAAKLCEYDAKGMAWGSAVAGSTPTASPSAVPPLASWRGLLGLAGPASGGTLVGTVATATIDIKRKLEAHYTLSNGQQPYVIQRGSLGISGKMSFIAADETPITKYLADTQEQFQLLISNGITGAGQRQLTVDCNLVDYRTAKINQGKTATMYDVEFDGLANSTSAGASGGLSPGKVTILNANAGTVY
jgi:hypothetical protein